MNRPGSLQGKISRRGLLAGAALGGFFGLLGRPAAEAQSTNPWAVSKAAPTPWRNWSGGLVAHPAGRFSPATESELVDFLSSTRGPIRPVGSGHSFSPLVPTDGQLIVIDQLAGLLAHDRDRLTATFGAGTRLSDMGQPLTEVGQAMLNLPDIDRQTLAGATATATHGTGIDFTCLSGFVSQLRLITPQGEVLDVAPDSHPALFNAARVSLGALGLVTRMTLQNRTVYKLKSRNWVQRTEDVLQDFDTSAAAHRHFEMFPLTHADYALVLAIDETDEAINNPPPDPEQEAATANALGAIAALPPAQRRVQLNALAEQIEPTEQVDWSYRILSNIRNSRFNEMEYSVPLHAGADCLREILATITRLEVDVSMPLEYRYVSRDDTWLGMSSGDEDHAAISIHRRAGEDYRPYFDLIEPIFWKYQGRPHWGKIHSLRSAELRELYPHFEEFQAVRRQLDPDGRLLNPHLRELFEG